MYYIIDHRTGKVVGTYTELKRARRRANELNQENPQMIYGAIRYGVMAI